MTLLKRATIKSYDAGSHLAAVGISGSLSVWLDSIAISDSIPAAAVVAGRECAVLFHEDDNPDDAVIVSVHGGGPPSSGGGGTSIEDADGDTKVQVEESADDDVIRFDTAGAERMTIDASGIFNVVEPFGHGIGTASAGDATTILDLRVTETVSTGARGLGINPTFTPSAANKGYKALGGNCLVFTPGLNVLSLSGLDYGVGIFSASGTPVVTRVELVKASFGAFGGNFTVTDLTGYRVDDGFTAGSPVYTRHQGLWSNIAGKSGNVDTTGLRITDITAGTNKHLIWAGPNVPSSVGLTNLRLDAGNPPNAALATEGDSQLHLTFMENGSLVMRQVRWRQQSSLGATDRVLIAQ